MPDTIETTKPTRNQQAVIESRIALDSAELFLLKYDAKLPPDLGALYVGGFGAHYDVGLCHRNEDDRNKALSHMGDVFGRGGWEAKLNVSYNFHGFDWLKIVDGVRLKIEGAQKIDQPQTFPVDPKQFPLQLEDSTPA